MSTLQFYIPRLAADAVSFPAIRAAAHRAGLSHPSIELRTYPAIRGKTRLTCSPEVAMLLIEQLRDLASAAEAYGKSALLIACATGVDAAFQAIDEERTRPPGESPAIHIRPVRR